MIYLKTYLIFCICVVKLATAAETLQMGTIKLTADGKMQFLKDIIDKTGLAYGVYRDTMDSTGWGTLDIVAGNNSTGQNDSLVMYAAGYLEGIFTALRIQQSIPNVHQAIFGEETGDTKTKTLEWFNTQHNWINSALKKYKSHNNGEKDEFLDNLGYIMQQFEGLVAGVKTKYPEINASYIYLLSANGDLSEVPGLMKRSKTKVSAKTVNTPDSTKKQRIIKSLSKDKIKMLNKKMTTKSLLTKIASAKKTSTKTKKISDINKMERCSAFIHVTPGFEEMFMAHSTWFDFRNTMRIYKHYTFDLIDKSVRNKKVSFSSYPGVLGSVDEFYILDNNMVVIQTSLTLFVTTLDKQIIPNSVLAWQRVRIANQMARNGDEWGKVIARNNSGTYNNQYMLLDLNKFRPGQDMQNGTLTIVEQMPGLVVYTDQTEILRHGYWASYNVAFHEAIYSGMGYSPKNNDYSFQLAVRAKIFREEIGNVKNLNDAKELIRSNKKGKVNSKGVSVCGLCCRYDLTDNNIPNGCYDAKVTSYDMALKFEAYAINGPSNTENLQTFEWSKYKTRNYSREGLADKYDFDWQLMQRFFD